ncbi:MAG: serine/threonine protein kinase [Chloroflexi bacterium]|jgi:eukaryotic-like serine/threonine-protein kinase|nr:serine/threonine protein kinase [Chloroflexota bacterium]MBT3670705.1 serine/threonine protein kinase [Chloroflexota bacterium]MBT4002636.1 serine/threonine protein kinase [Chloroflexota bacterium]MBT4306259.1 serine/threonine protein kinase [Chloroflexota bacterium]MBT4532860.1 serine/threonine protein kinase [Chloroflexota bacterium]
MIEKELLNKRYKLEEMVGRGGMAMVYRAKDLMLERDVAIKVLKKEFSIDPAFRERFRQEAKAAANLSHPNIVTVHDFGFDDERLFIVMEYVPGEDLNSIIQKRGRLGILEGTNLAIKVSKGIGYAHRAGLVHCDVKPHNFLVTPDKQLKVTDFGIARALASINPNEESDVIWGSPQYFSPEQAGGNAPSPSSDVYSLGVVMYQMFTGQLPYIGKTSTELARLHRRGIPIPPKEINPAIPNELQEVILKVLAKEPSARYRTADQLGRVLQTISARIPSNDSFSIDENAEDLIPTKPTNRPSIQVLFDKITSLSKEKDQRTLDSQTAPKVDWFAVFLGLVAFAAVIGLVPLSIWVFNTFSFL